LTAGYNAELNAWQAEQANSPWRAVTGLAGAWLGGGGGNPFTGFADGGEVSAIPMEGEYIPRGEVRGPGGPKQDAIPAALSDGEYVIPEEVVRRKGTEFFDKLIEKTHKDLVSREQGVAVPPPTTMPAYGIRGG
jgi:hypothetical protein